MPTPPSKYLWRVTYEGGKTATSDEISYEQIDRDNLRIFELIHRKSGQILTGMAFEPGDVLLWRKREQMQLGGKAEAVHLVCRERYYSGYQVRLIDLVFEIDGHVEKYNGWTTHTSWGIEPERLPFEVKI